MSCHSFGCNVIWLCLASAPQKGHPRLLPLFRQTHGPGLKSQPRSLISDPDFHLHCYNTSTNSSSSSSSSRRRRRRRRSSSSSSSSSSSRSSSSSK